MKNLRVYAIITITMLFGLLVSSCKDGGNSTPNPEIASITPTTGPVGTAINIRGRGFGSDASAIEVSFNGTATEAASVGNRGIQTTGSSASKIEVNLSDIPAEITSVSDTLIETSVPEGASSGAIRASVGGVTIRGPAFTVDPLLPGIQSIQPDSGPVSTSVSINGMGFGNDTSDVEVRFNGITAENSFVSDTLIQTSVPEGATSGTMQVVVGGVSIDGPVFTVEPTMPGIQSIRPDSGEVGSVVTITGMNFGSTPAENSVTFNGIAAPIDSANASRIKTRVPQGASTGPVEVTVDGVMVTGPNFKVFINTGTLRVLIRTTGENRDPDGYTVSVDGNEIETGVSDSLFVPNLEVGNHSVGLSGVASNCSVSGANPQNISIKRSSTTSTRFTVECRGAVSIQSVSPDSGLVGSVVTIRGSGFSSNTDENVVRFNGTEARVDSASANRIKTTVPEDATSGPVEVTVAGATATGPDFKVLNTTEDPGTISTFTTISAGRDHSCGIAASGDAYCWGNNEFGQLGNGEVGVGLQKNLPFKINMPAGVSFTAISVGFRHTIAITSSGKAYAWGLNTFGQLGDGTTTDRLAPVKVQMPSGVSFTGISSGVLHSVAITADGQAYAWGRNNVSQLGNGSTTNSATPEAVSMPVGVIFTAIDAGDRYNLALSSTGQAYAWGANFFGRLGDGTTTNRQTPVPVVMPVGVSFTKVSASSGRISMALSAGGQAYGWGLNNFGQLGDGSTTDQDHPVAVDMPAGVGFADIDTGENHTLAITASGTAYAWGGNGSGELGNGGFLRQSMPMPVAGGTGFTEINAGQNHNITLGTNGQGYGWGENLDGELGDGTFVRRTSVVKVGGN